jgi:hypothetical protein
MEAPSSGSTSEGQKPDEATIEHSVEKVNDETPADSDEQSPITESGLPVEEQLRKEWDPKKDGGLPTF